MSTGDNNDNEYEEGEKASRNARILPADGHVGFDTLPDQIVNQMIKKGFRFNILCVGATGVGKSTLMNSLFNTTFEVKPSSHDMDSVKLESNHYEVVEKGVHLKLNIIETAGFGDQLNKEGTFDSISEYLDAQFEAYLHEELKFKRSLSTYDDSRVHVCLYFICPTRVGLKPIDIACLKMLDSKVNIIPIIAKADAIPHGALKMYKDKIISDLIDNKINTYQFPTDDESVANINRTMGSQQPFAVVGSNEFVRVGNKVVRARQYPWGVVQVENEHHCEFVKLREMLLRTNMDDLLEQTHNEHYERYRCSRLKQALKNMGFSDSGLLNKSMTAEEVYENRKQMFSQELELKEKELMQILDRRNEEMNTKFDCAELELNQNCMKMDHEYAAALKKLEEERKSMDNEINEFIRITNAHSKKSLKAGSSSSSLFGTLGRCNRK